MSHSSSFVPKHHSLPRPTIITSDFVVWLINSVIAFAFFFLPRHELTLPAGPRSTRNSFAGTRRVLYVWPKDVNLFVFMVLLPYFGVQNGS